MLMQHELFLFFTVLRKPCGQVPCTSTERVTPISEAMNASPVYIKIASPLLKYLLILAGIVQTLFFFRSEFINKALSITMVYFLSVHN
jgi:hypothetical protein